LLLDESIVLRRDNPTIEVVLYLITSLHTVGNVYADPGSSDWDLTLTVEQIATGDWATSTSIATTTLSDEPLTTHATAFAFTSPDVERYKLQRQYQFRKARSQYVSGGGDWEYVPREGQLWREDIGLIQQVSISVDVSSFEGSDLADCVRVSVAADYQDSTLAGFVLTTTTGAALGYALECTCAGYSIYQRGDAQ